MRVLYFSRDYTPHDHRFLSAMVSLGLDPFFMRLERQKRQTEDRALPAGVELVSSQFLSAFRWTDLPGRVLEMRRVLRAVQPDVVHAGPVPTCAYIAALAGAAPLVSMSWGSDLLVDARKNAWTRNLVRFTLRRSDWLLGDCEAVRGAAAELGFPPERTTLFPWGVDLEKFAPVGRISKSAVPEKNGGTAPRPTQAGLRERLGWNDAFVVLSLRSWEPIYGVETVVEGFARAASQDKRLRLILLSGGSLAPRIQSLLSQHALHDRVHLGGQVSQDNLPRYTHAADLYLSASHSDGSSVSLLEALASGLPALVSDIPGNREWVQEDKQGWLFPVGDAEALAVGLLRAANAGDGLAQMSLNARRTAEERADWRKNMQKILETYQKVAA